MSASLKKSFADVTRRKGRTLMVVLGIFIGVLGLTGVTFIQQTILSAFTYSTGTAANSPLANRIWSVAWATTTV